MEKFKKDKFGEASNECRHYKLDNVIAILDFNGLQIDGSNEEVMNINPIGEKVFSFWMECN